MHASVYMYLKVSRSMCVRATMHLCLFSVLIIETHMNAIPTGTQADGRVNSSLQGSCTVPVHVVFNAFTVSMARHRVHSIFPDPPSFSLHLSCLG